MPLVLSGANHKTSPLWLRERAALSGVSLFDTRKRLLGKPGISEVAVVSTCNRVEFYAAGPDSKDALKSLRLFLIAEYGLPAYEMDDYFYFREGSEAAAHLFTVVTGADSMVVGEEQVAGQVAKAFDHARQEGTMGPELTRLERAAKQVVDRVRRQTGFGSSPVSVGSVAVEWARSRLGSLKGRAAMILGAGDMGILTAHALSANGIASILVANRTLSRAQEVAHSIGAAPWITRRWRPR
jgi:glutamyl-tRNA reductase